MKRKLFDKALDFEINLIGYKEKGESIVFFLRADGKVVYAGLVDCYEKNSENRALMLLEKEKLTRVDFVCWTHPHEDHTLGMDKVLTQFCDEETLFWIPPFISDDVSMSPLPAQDIYKNLFEIIESRKRNKMKVREASDSKILEKLFCYGNSSIYPYLFEIKSFAPDSNLLGKEKLQERLKMGNLYSIGLVINIGHFYVVLAGDVENRTIKYIPEFNFDIYERVDYVKIPHHSSESSSALIDRFNELNIAAPAVAVTTVFHVHNLPDKKVLKKYVLWGEDINVYSTGDIETNETEEENYGIIKTTFDVLEKKEVPIETDLFGNAVSVNEIV